MRLIDAAVRPNQIPAITSASVALQAFYDGASATTWERTSTGAEGAIWIPGSDVGNATASLTPTKSTGAQPIFDGGITFVTVISP
jgi:hypothetical protein